MKAVWIGVLAASALLLAGGAQADAELAKKSGCLNCHNPDKNMAAPALKNIAAKYRGDANAEAYLAGKIKKGSAGVWKMPMPAMPPNNVTEANAKVLANWILSLK
ncbi:c-type cytochrome [Nitrosovibrio sp. Nv17]|jgi:cytochrome c|uniref:c-type cytochrome n=1 Tax=Nitrosovibrio sp. Nv17 TaxID=1855339 RepID=UPI0009088F48|nr:c-type cytochrome [Nitrosovibrio sp. Nv17]SFW10661.1 cytochrome c [Nitrosovibrio sp. Nv17]